MAAYTESQLYNALKELGVIDRKALDAAYDESQKQKIPLENILLEKDLISDENLGKTIADLVSRPLARLGEISIPPEILKIIPEVVAKKQKIIAFNKDNKGLHVAMFDPNNIQMKDFLEKRVGIPVVVHFATEKDINNALFLYKKDLATTFDEIIGENIKEAKNIKSNNDPPIIKIVDAILGYSYNNKASDVHVEPLKDKSIVRFRIDGILHDILSLPSSLHGPIVTRIKVLAFLKTDEHHAGQDGKLQFKADSEDVDVRVSIVPITNGEKIVMRLLSERSRQFSLVDLGFSPTDLEKVKKAYTKPYGMILATGPTGAGKTTTIYSVLKLLNDRGVNIMTIEDPVEYDIEGVNQIQVNPKTNLTFAEGLKSIVRQDPDIILVGEIRDFETADIAINSAMTGHIVLSTLHTNDAATAIPRLLDMNVEPFLLASTVNVIIAQRLVRKIHGRCRVSVDTEVESLTKYIEKPLLKKTFGESSKVRLYKGKGCQLDHGIGYEGRVGIFEVLIIDEEIRRAIIERRDAAEIKKIAAKNGMTTMIQDGLEKVKEGLTTIDEVLRVTKE
ncbi:type II/IV secretion system protein [Candidatus Roizmanbacteria bacterium]|nr:type II/IV secretion system protein [Candidatus Roizmanbacteria bacterium]